MPVSTPVPSDRPSLRPSVSQAPSDVPEDSLDLTTTNLNLPASELANVLNAFDRVTRAVTQGLPNVPTRGPITAERFFGGPDVGECSTPDVIDDIHLCVYIDDDLTTTNVLGFAGPRQLRSGSLLPAAGIMGLSPVAFTTFRFAFDSVVVSSLH